MHVDHAYTVNGFPNEQTVSSQDDSRDGKLDAISLQQSIAMVRSDFGIMSYLLIHRLYLRSAALLPLTKTATVDDVISK